MTTNQRIAYLIKTRCLKQSAVGLAAGYTTRTFNAIIKGRRKITVDDILPICNVLGVTPNELFDLSTTQEPSERS